MRAALPLLATLSACASPLSALKSSRELVTEAAHYHLRWSTPNEPDQARVGHALERVSPGLARWGGLAAPVTVSVLPTHEALERAVCRRNYEWLKAWAQYDSVILQAPNTWAGSADAQLDELLLHELTHCLMFQRSATPETWTKKEIPMWFREGLATVTAQQGYRFPTLESLARWVNANPERDVFRDGDALSQLDYEAVYGIAFHAVTFLLRRYGEAGVSATMAAMHRGLAFPSAFAAAVGVPVESFQREFLIYLRMWGFRGAGLPLRRGQRKPLDELLRPHRAPEPSPVAP